MMDWFLNHRKQIIIVAPALSIAASIVIAVMQKNNTKVIVEGPVYASTIAGVPGQGEVHVVGTLEEEMQKYSYDNSYFHVEVCLHFDIEDRFTYKGKTMNEWREDPVFVLYDEVREVWTTEVYTFGQGDDGCGRERGRVCAGVVEAW